MSVAGTTTRLTAAERAREPRSLGVIAWFDGWAQGSGLRAVSEYPRRLDADEARQWRYGFVTGRRERVCASWHGCTRCRGDHPVRLATDDERHTSLAAVVQLELAECRRAQASNGSPATE